MHCARWMLHSTTCSSLLTWTSQTCGASMPGCRDPPSARIRYACGQLLLLRGRASAPSAHAAPDFRRTWHAHIAAVLSAAQLRCDRHRRPRQRRRPGRAAPRCLHAPAARGRGASQLHGQRGSHAARGAPDGTPPRCPPRKQPCTPAAVHVTCSTATATNHQHHRTPTCVAGRPRC